MSHYDTITTIIAEQLGVDKDKLTPQLTFVGGLGADSLDTVELVMELEEEFDICIPDEAIESLKDSTTIGDVVEWVEKALAA